MVVEGKGKVGPILGIVGASLLLIAGFIALGAQGLMEIALASAGLTWADVGFDPILFTVRSALTLVFALVGLIGAILGLMDKKIGVYLMLIFGLVATVGMFIPIGSLTIGYMTFPVTMNGALLFVDPILILLGGILGLFLKA